MKHRSASMSEILEREPVDRNASIVTSQTGINKVESEKLLLEQERQQAIKEQKLIDNRIWEVAKGTPEHRKLKTRSRCLLYTSPSPRDATLSRMPSSA